MVPYFSRSNKQEISAGAMALLLCLMTPSWMRAQVEEAPPGTFQGLSFSVANETIPAGGILQMQVMLTEPKPILKGTQRLRLASASATRAASVVTSASHKAAPSTVQGDVLGPVRDIALFSPDGQVSGVAVLSADGPEISFSSPLKTFGTVIDSPVIAITLPVLSAAQAGQTESLGLDPAESLWFSPTSDLYPTEANPGVLTVGGTLAINDISPAAGVVPAGHAITIKGMGFTSSTTVRVNEAKVATTHVVSASEIAITLTTDFNLIGHRVRVIASGNHVVEYYPYPRTLLSGQSKEALLATSLPLFSQNEWTVAYLKPAAGARQTAGLALQNIRAGNTEVQLQLLTETGGLLHTTNVTLPTMHRILRSAGEYFPGVLLPLNFQVRVSANQPIQMLGLLADASSGSVSAIDPVSAP